MKYKKPIYCTYFIVPVLLCYSFRRCILVWQGNVSQLKNAKCMVTAAVQHYQTTVLQEVGAVYCVCTCHHFMQTLFSSVVLQQVETDVLWYFYNH